MSSRKIGSWKRPKPKVYECNARDAERFYKSSYNEYLTEKKERNDRANSVCVDTTSYFDHLRADNYESPRYKRQHALGLDRENSFLLATRNSAGKTLSNQQSSFDRPSTEFKPLVTKGLGLNEGDHEKDSIEQRLARLKKLREEMGLPSNVQTDPIVTTTGSDNPTSSSSSSSSSSRAKNLFAASNGTADNGSSSKYNSSRSSITSSRSYQPPEEKTSRFTSRTERSTRTSGRTYGDANDDDSNSKYSSSSRAERVTRSAARSTANDDYKYSSKLDSKSDDTKYSTRAGRKALDLNGDANGDKYSSMSSTTRTSSAKTKANARLYDDLTGDADDKMASALMKKLPSAQDILDRINKMNIDDL